MFPMSSSTVIPPLCSHPDLSLVSHFDKVSENEILKITENFPTKSYLLDTVLTFHLKDCVDISLPSITKPINLSLTDGRFFPKIQAGACNPHYKYSITFK